MRAIRSVRLEISLFFQLMRSRRPVRNVCLGPTTGTVTLYSRPQTFRTYVQTVETNGVGLVKGRRRGHTENGLRGLNFRIFKRFLSLCVYGSLN